MPIAQPRRGSMSLLACAVAALFGANLQPARAEPAVAPGVQDLVRVRTIWAFSNGHQPVGALLPASDGNLYGATEYGPSRHEAGTLFRLAALPHRMKQLHVFRGDDGEKPLGSLVEGADGWLYGTTAAGGGLPQCDGCGTIFRISLVDERFEVLYRFTGGASDGRTPSSGLVKASDGNMYGSTRYGGEGDAGTVYRLTPEGAVTVLHAFDRHGIGSRAGTRPNTLVQGADGLLHGTTETGGSPRHCTRGGGCGAVFTMTLAGEIVSDVPMRDDAGWGPRTGVVQAADGDDYGTAFGGGREGDCPDTCGTIFRVRAADGQLTRVHAFDGMHGWGPEAPPLQGVDGYLYGTTRFGGATKFKRKGCGTIWRLAPDGDFKTIYTFKCLRDGEAPTGGLVQAPDGTLYGTTLHGGNGSYGLVYRVEPRTADASGH